MSKNQADLSQFQENPPGSPFVFSGQSSNLDKAAQQLEKLDVPDDVEINASDKGVEVTFRRTVSFEQGSIEISEKAVKAMKKMLPIIGQMQNDIEISGHTDDTDVNNRFPSNWEMSVARASAIAGFLQANKIAPERMQVVGYGDSRPRFNADTAYKRALNRRVENAASRRTDTLIVSVHQTEPFKESAMGQMIDEEDCEVCIPFDQEWILPTVIWLPCFFASSCFFFRCAFMRRRNSSVASSFKPLPAEPLSSVKAGIQ